jgi:hypothetical protein
MSSLIITLIFLIVMESQHIFTNLRRFGTYEQSAEIVARLGREADVGMNVGGFTLCVRDSARIRVK